MLTLDGVALQQSSTTGVLSALLARRPLAAGLCAALGILEAHLGSALIHGTSSSPYKAELFVGSAAGLTLGIVAHRPLHALSLSVVFAALAMLQLAWDEESAAAVAHGQLLSEYKLLSPQYRAQRLLEDDLEDGEIVDHDPYDSPS